MYTNSAAIYSGELLQKKCTPVGQVGALSPLLLYDCCLVGFFVRVVCIAVLAINDDAWGVNNPLVWLLVDNAAVGGGLIQHRV